jgi:hypothetical protein
MKLDADRGRERDHSHEVRLGRLALLKQQQDQTEEHARRHEGIEPVHPAIGGQMRAGQAIVRQQF